MLHIIRNPDISWKDLEASTNQWMKTQSRFIKSLLDEIYYIRRHEDALAKGEIGRRSFFIVSVIVVILNSISRQQYYDECVRSRKVELFQTSKVG